MIMIAIGIKVYRSGFVKTSISILVVCMFIQIISMLNISEVSILAPIQSRLQIKNGAFIADNRSDEVFDNAFKEFMSGDVSRILLGNGKDAAINNPQMSASYTYKMLIYDFGIIGFISLIAWIIFISKMTYGRNEKATILLIVF